jgi:hypothetical protein
VKEAISIFRIMATGHTGVCEIRPLPEDPEKLNHLVALVFTNAFQVSIWI